MDDHRPSIGEILDAGTWRRRVLAVRDRVDAATATASSADGLITATVGGRGELRALTLDARVYRDHDSARLAGEITRTVRAAVDQVRAGIRTDIEAIVAGRR